jgi:hypothetical protein
MSTGHPLEQGFLKTERYCKFKTNGRSSVPNGNFKPATVDNGLFLVATSNQQQLTMDYSLWQLQTASFVVGTARGCGHYQKKGTTGGVAGILVMLLSEGLIESKASPSLLFCTDEHFNTKCASFKRQDPSHVAK